MPVAYKRCVKRVARTIKPRAGRTKTQAAHAVCTKRNAGNIKQYRARKRKGK
jgi:hypothetical protein